MHKKFCISCNQEINPLRIKALPTAKTCVECSTESPKRGRILTLGEGDHTYNEIEILSEESYRSITELEMTRSISKKKVHIELQDLDEDEFGDSDYQIKATYDSLNTQDDKPQYNDEEE